MVLSHLVVRVAAPELDLVEMAREVLQAPSPGEHQLLGHVLVVLARVGDVLALAGCTGSLEEDGRRHARPAGGRLRLAPLERVPVHADLEGRHRVPERHTG
jgi:hypothetical protein